MTLRGVIFDMGGTLLEFHPPNGGWREMEEMGAAGWYACLRTRGYALPGEARVKQAVWEQISAAWRRMGEASGRLSREALAEMALIHQLGRVADQFGAALTPDDARAAERAFVEAVQTCVRPLPGGAAMLRALKARGLRLALVSNTMWPGVYHEADLARFGLCAPFDALFFSSEELAWKPDPEIFHRAVRALDLAPEEAAYVGDSLALDVLGAQGAGLRAVWIENADPYAPEGATITPDATIRQLLDLLPIVDDWCNNRLSQSNVTWRIRTAMAREKVSDSKTGTAGQRKAAARARQAQQKKQQTYVAIGVVVVVVALVVVIAITLNRPVEIEMPTSIGNYAAAPTSVTDEGYYRLGDPDAPVLMEEFSNFTCTHCASLHKTVKGRLLDSYIAEGTLSVVFIPIVNSQLSGLGAQAALCAGQQDPAKFWEMHDVLFTWVDEGHAYNLAQVTAAAERLGLDAGALNSCLSSEKVVNILQTAATEATAREIEGTPALFFNGARPVCGESSSKCEGDLPYDLIVQNIDRQLAGQ